MVLVKFSTEKLFGSSLGNNEQKIRSVFTSSHGVLSLYNAMRVAHSLIIYLKKLSFRTSPKLPRQINDGT